MTETQLMYSASAKWYPDRPHVLVAACSDGRLQESVDEFLTNHLGVTSYDRLYLPGGPGALSTSGVEYIRSENHKKELKFLIEVHEIEQVIFLFHGPAPGGPADSICADYARVLGLNDSGKVARTQEQDLSELTTYFLSWPHIKVHAFRCEVDAERTVRFVDLLAGS